MTTQGTIRASCVLASIAALCAAGCERDLGSCDQEAAAELVYGRGNLIATAGQALVHDSCGNGAFCHSSRAQGEARRGAPAGLDFDMLPDPSGWRAMVRHRHAAWEAIDEGSMPPRGEAATVLGDADWTFDPERSAGAPRLGSVFTERGKEVVRNWLACSAPIVKDTLLPTPPVTDGGTADAGALDDGGTPEPPDFGPLFEEIIEQNCATAGCHDDKTRAGGLEMTDECGALAGLLEAGPCKKPRVLPSNRDSFLVEKLQATTPSCGSRMPFVAPLPQADIDRIADWIAQGAHSKACAPDDQLAPECVDDVDLGCSDAGSSSGSGGTTPTSSSTSTTSASFGASQMLRLYRPGGCLYVGFERGAATSLGMSDTEFERAVLDAFAAWAAIDCGGDGPPGFEVQSVGVVEAGSPFVCNAAPEVNIDLWMLSLGLSGGKAITRSSGATAGITLPTLVIETGEVYDADVLLNELWFSVLDESDLAPFLHVVAMHEAGHVLGLTHSRDEDAIMHQDYRVTADRALTQDDVDRICQLYPPRDVQCGGRSASDAAFDSAACQAAFLGGGERASMPGQDAMPSPSPPPPPREDTARCTVSRPASAGGPAALTAVLALGLLLLRRRARRDRRRARTLAFAFSSTCVAILLVCACSGDGCGGQRNGRAAPPKGLTALDAVDVERVKIDPELSTRIDAIAKVCQATPGGLQCPAKEHVPLVLDLLRGAVSRVGALPTFARLLHGPDETKRAIAAEVMDASYLLLDEGATFGSIDDDVAALLLRALRDLPAVQANQIVNATVHAAVLSRQPEALIAVLDARGDARLRVQAYRGVMKYGRLSMLPQLQAAAAGPDAQLALAAVEAPRNMRDWSAAEEDALCPWLLGIAKGGNRALAVHAVQGLEVCRGKHVDALLEWARAASSEGKFAERWELTPLRTVCGRPEHVSGPQCARTLDFLASLVDDEGKPPFMRDGALAVIRKQVEMLPQAEPAAASARELLARLGTRYVGHANPRLAKQARLALQITDPASASGAAGPREEARPPHEDDRDER